MSPDESLEEGSKRRLLEKSFQLGCSWCGESEWMSGTVDLVVRRPAQDDPVAQIPDDPPRTGTIPSVYTVCKNCGKISFHSIMALAMAEGKGDEHG